MDDKERFYKITIAILLALVLVMGLVILLRQLPRKTGPRPIARTTGPTKATAGKIAIVIDDVGYSLGNFGIIEAIKSPITFSVLPGLDFSDVASRKLNSLGFQVILHLPMEPKEKTGLEENTVLASMDEERIRSIIDKDLLTVNQVRGVSNHMGSKVTENEPAMSLVLNEIKNKHLFFLDSFVTADSVAAKLAENKKIKFAKRDVFLDNSADLFYIRQQLQRLKRKARENGQAVGIGHDRKTTLEVLKEEIPKMEKEGFKFVFVSELVR
jgi:polysaccharide deacetylase 2 family uncharacterized protein YibQ